MILSPLFSWASWKATFFTNLHLSEGKFTDHKSWILAMEQTYSSMHLKLEPSHYNHGLQVLATEPLCLNGSDSCQQTGGWFITGRQQGCSVGLYSEDVFWYLKVLELTLFFFVAKTCHWFGLGSDDGLWNQVVFVLIFFFLHSPLHYISFGNKFASLCLLPFVHSPLHSLYSR